jgi:hypothetical protein
VPGVAAREEVPATASLARGEEAGPGWSVTVIGRLGRLDMSRLLGGEGRPQSGLGTVVSRAACGAHKQTWQGHPLVTTGHASTGWDDTG